MIDKQKLLQWVENKQYVYSPSASDSELDAAEWKGSRNVLSMLERDIENGNLAVEEVAHERSEASSASAART